MRFVHAFMIWRKCVSAVTSAQQGAKKPGCHLDDLISIERRFYHTKTVFLRFLLSNSTVTAAVIPNSMSGLFWFPNKQLIRASEMCSCSYTIGIDNKAMRYLVVRETEQLVRNGVPFLWLTVQVPRTDHPLSTVAFCTSM
jgi:hypothetical protein